MFKKILLILFSVVFVGAIVFFMLKLKDDKKVNENPLNAIPADAAYVFSSGNIQKLWNSVSENSLIWDELRAFEYIKIQEKGIKRLDSILRLNPDFQSNLAAQNIYISCHKAGTMGLDFLYLFNQNPDFDGEDLLDFAKNFYGDFKISSRNFQNQKIYTCQSLSEDFHIYMINGIIAIATSGNLAEKSIKQLESKNGLLNNPSFKSVYQTAGIKEDANLFINYEKAPELFDVVVTPTAYNDFSLIKNFGNWAALDIKQKPNELIINGFSSTSDSTLQYLNIFKKQKAQSIEVTRILPENTCQMIFVGLSNFSDYQVQLKNYVEKKAKWLDINTVLNDFETKNKINLINEFSTWVGNEITLGYTAPQILPLNHTAFAVLKTSNLEAAQNSLKSIAKNIDKNNFQSERYKDFELNRIDLDSTYFQCVLGYNFVAIHQPFYTNIGRYIVMTNNLEKLKDFVDYYLAEKVLTKNKSYIEFAQNISDESNVMIYANIAKSQKLFDTYASVAAKIFYGDQTDIFKKFEGICIQFSNEKSLFYTNIYLKHNPIFKEENSSLWEAQLDTIPLIKPKVVINHNDQSKEIFVQDVANNVYLITNTGRIIWKKQIESPIISEVFQIDYLKNNKLQYLFNTENKIYLIDRNGDFVEKYPIELPEKASCGLSLFDYDLNKDYRILLPLQNKKILNFRANGMPLDGWSFRESEEKISIPLQFFSINNLDYIFTVDIKGKVYVLNRKGETRILLREKLSLSKNANLTFQKGSDLSNTYLVLTDSVGKIQKLNFQDELEFISVEEFSSNHFFEFRDLNNDKKREYIFLDKNLLSVYDSEQKLLFTKTFDNEIQNSIIYYQFPNGLGKLGILDKKQNEIYLIDEKGETVTGFPLKGTTHFSISDINEDARFNVIVGGLGKNVYTYNLR